MKKAMQESTIILEAIARLKCLSGVYNKAQVKLAPHILYTRHGDLFVDAVTVEREGRPPVEPKLGVFKLAGLSGLAISDRDFEPQSLFDPAEERYDGTTLFAVERAA